MSPYLLAIDNGSQSTKVTVVDELGHVHARGQRRLAPTRQTGDGRVVHPGDDVWESIVLGTRDALGRFAGDPGLIVGVGLCTIRFCRALLDERGRLVEPMLSWMDERVGRAHVDDDPRVRWITTSSGYVTHRLTGRTRDSAANAEGVWPLDHRTARWSTDPNDFERAGIPRRKLFDLVDPGEVLGAVTAEAAAETGIPPGVPVFATANDKAVEALGAGVVREDQLLLSLGTYIAAMTPGRDAPPASDAFWVNSGAMPHTVLFESGGIRRGMWTVGWFRTLVEGEAPGADLTATVPLEAELSAAAESVAPGAGGLYALLDWLAPADHPHRRGALIGFDGSQGRAEIFRALLEGIAFTMREAVDAMGSALGRRFESVVVSGGGSRSDLMMRIIAAVLELPAVRTEVPDAAGMGAAVSAAVGSGVHPIWEEAVAVMVRPVDRFEPQSAVVAAYAPHRRAHAALRDYTDPLFERLARERGSG